MERLRQMVESISDLVSIPPDTITVEDLQDDIKNLLHEAQPELSCTMPVRTKVQPETRPSVPVLTPVRHNPFHQRNSNMEQSMPTTSISARKPVTSQPYATNKNPTSPLVQGTSQERPSDTWYRARQEQLAESTKEVHIVPTPSNVSSDSSFPAFSDLNPPIDVANWSHQFNEHDPLLLDLTADLTPGYGFYQDQVATPSSQQMTQQHLSLTTQQGYTQQSWRPTSRNPFYS